MLVHISFIWLSMADHFLFLNKLRWAKFRTGNVAAAVFYWLASRLAFWKSDFQANLDLGVVLSTKGCSSGISSCSFSQQWSCLYVYHCIYTAYSYFSYIEQVCFVLVIITIIYRTSLFCAWHYNNKSLQVFCMYMSSTKTSKLQQGYELIWRILKRMLIAETLKCSC